MSSHTQIWESSLPPLTAGTPLNPSHAGVELAILARLLLELELGSDGHDLLAGLHLRRRDAVKQFTNAPEVPCADLARAQQLKGWKIFVDSQCTASLGFPRIQKWAAAEVRI